MDHGKLGGNEYLRVRCEQKNLQTWLCPLPILVAPLDGQTVWVASFSVFAGDNRACTAAIPIQLFGEPAEFEHTGLHGSSNGEFTRVYESESGADESPVEFTDSLDPAEPVRWPRAEFEQQ